MTTIVHASGRFDRPLGALDDQLADLTDTASIVGVTEQGRMTRARRNTLRRRGWGWIHIDERGADDCALLYDGGVWVVDGWVRAVQLTRITWRRVAKYGGKITPPVHALVVPLRSIRKNRRRRVAIVVHMPTRSSVLRRRAWASCGNGLVRLVKQLRAADPLVKIIICADWNADWHNPKDRELLEDLARRLKVNIAWAVHPTSEGSHGRRLIDGVWTDLDIEDAAVLPPHRASDHRGVTATT